MLKKCTLFIKGCIRMRTVIIILILLVTVYVYQNKFQEISNWSVIKNSRENGALFYLEGIWGKMKRIQKISDGRSQRAMELFEETKIVTEKSGLFSLAIPKSWNVVSEEGINERQVARIVVESPSFSQRIEGGNIFYDDGAQLTVQVMRGEDQSVKLPDGGHGSMLIKKGIIEASNQIKEYHVIKNENVKEGEIMDAHVLRSGNTYNFRLVDNPRIFTGGEFSFQEIMRSFQFLK